MKTKPSTLLSGFSTVSAFFTTRHGGVSKAPYSNANLAFHVNDDPSDVMKNHTLLAATLGYDLHTLIHMRQIHSDRIVLVDRGFNFDTPPECDALITNLPNTPLMVMSADCTGILIYDPVQKAIAAIHAGRAGALSGILPKTVTRMEKEFKSNPNDLHIVLGPSIGGCCYEINETIAAACETKGYASALRREDTKVFLDVTTILMEQLKELKIENTEVIDHCTSCRCEEYFSYRADHQHTGRIAGVIILR
jgi:polyphenol oxidase